ncbi:MAG TPA: enoyl-CoA hydratase/isomerase family protein [Vicinamibacterales bacterium]|nr:enoyl-CoA hydratase/isomerase family protein [Vicinamibacterales bacterium]
MSTTQAIYESDGPIATLTFNRPEARNAMTWEMYQALVDACDRVDDDPAARVLILKGAGGKAFVAGTDISQFADFRSANDGIAYEERIDRVFDRLERMTKATIAQIEGVAAGGGCGIALMCDLRIATPESSFGIPVARTLGNCLSGATYSRLVDVLGPGLVKDMLLTGRFINGTEALARGLVTRLEAAAGIDAAVHDCALGIASNAPLTIRATKEMIRRIMGARRLPSDADRDVVSMCYASRDFREGVEAFVAKRRPSWTGS